MFARSDAVRTLTIVIAALAMVALVIRGAEVLLGGLPGGVELVGWAFGIAAVVIALALATWRRAQAKGEFAVNVLRALTPFAITGAFALIASFLLFYSSGHYEKGGYERLVLGLAIVVVAALAGALAGARSVRAATSHNPLRAPRVR